MKIRIKFRKNGAMKFIGHLDIMRYFQKAMRRADIDIRYSEGFSPHQIMSFAAPLGLGITSDGEYFDIEVNTTRTTEESLKALNEVMVEGIEVTEYVGLPDHAKTAMSIVAAADYDLFFKDNDKVPATFEEFQEGLSSFFERQEEILYTKQTKKGEKTIDFKQLVYKIHIKETDKAPSFYLMVSTGSTDNIKPELVIEALHAHMGLAWEENAIQIHRRDIYFRSSDGSFVSLGQMGEEIV